MVERQTIRTSVLRALMACCAVSSATFAGGVPLLEEVIVTGSRTEIIGVADSANVGTVTQEQLEARTVYRPGELLETTPGLIVSQHSGEGKANQFYLRGFNLDHGTDLRTTVDGMIVNQRSHAHGQGWTDLNFLIPELATGLEYKKGPYYAEEGDFASAGAVAVKLMDELDRGIAELAGGQNGFRRALLADSTPFGSVRLLGAFEYLHNDGPFTHPDDYRKFNGVVRLSGGDRAAGFNVTLMGYGARWNSTDQIAARALVEGVVADRFDAIDPTDGGSSHRYSLSAAWRRSDGETKTRVDLYAIDWQLALFSNFTYFLDDPVNGDQFAQPDRRVTAALNASHEWQLHHPEVDSHNTIGLQVQNDNIFNGLFSTKARQTLSVTREDHIVESSAGVYAKNETHWTDWFRSVAGIRADYYRFKVASDRIRNSGMTTQSIVNPKFDFAFGPWANTEYYLNFGGGFHSNDARGATLTVDPKTGDPADKVTPLVRSRGYEAGARTAVVPGLQTSLSIYRLDFDSELVFAGDAGTTEAGRPSRRDGVELANFFRYEDWLTIDADIAYAKARFRDLDPSGQRIPGAVEGVASFAIALDNAGPYFGGVQWRYFGPRPLLEDNAVRSHSTATFNGRIGYKIGTALRATLEAFNLLNQRASAIDYYYVSRFPGEAATGVADAHFHPIESRSFRFSLSASF